MFVVYRPSCSVGSRLQRGSIACPARPHLCKPNAWVAGYGRTSTSAKASTTERPEVVADELTHFLQSAPGDALSNLQRADAAWSALCLAPTHASFQEVIREVATPRPGGQDVQHFDAVVMGGTLGIFLATALLLRGRRVAIIERNQLRGREQEWNISRHEMQVFLDMGLLTRAELDSVLVSEFNPVRVGFAGMAGAEIVTRDILNCGVLPARLVELTKARYLAAGGVLMEGTDFKSATVHPDGVHVTLAMRGCAAPGAGGAGGDGALLQTSYADPSLAGQMAVSAEVLVDAMGSFSPIAAQARKGRKPDSVVLMVGSCARGIQNPPAADLLYSFTPLNKERKLQYFWEVFPARDGVTTYMFAYADATPGRTSLEDMFRDYLRLLPQYQALPGGLGGLRPQRTFFGFVPNWHDSPLQPPTARLLPVGDAAGNRSALSFAGFGAMARHLQRLTDGLEEAMETRQLSKGALGGLQPRSPIISMTAAMQYSMGTRAGQDLASAPPRIITDYLATSFAAMRAMGPHVYRPFLQDYLQWGCMWRVVGDQLLHAPRQLVQMSLFMRSAKAGSMFVSSFFGILAYDLLFRLAVAVDPAHRTLLAKTPGLLFRWRRLVEAFKYGSANDYEEA